jgi:hypothetical protein
MDLRVVAPASEQRLGGAPGALVTPELWDSPGAFAQAGRLAEGRRFSGAKNLRAVWSTSRLGFTPWRGLTGNIGSGLLDFALIPPDGAMNCGRMGEVGG